MQDPAWTEASGRWRTWAVGATAGLLNGLIALGGGILVTPFLVAYRRLSPQVAVGTSLVVVVLLSTIGFIAHAFHGNLAIEVSYIFVCLLGGLVGTIVGSKILATLTPRWLMQALSVFLVLVSARLVIQGFGLVQFQTVTAAAVPWAALFVVGAATGVLSAILGVGGGALALLSLATVYGVPLKEGLSVALALNVSNALSGVVQHVRNKTIHLQELQSLIPTAVIGVLIGAWLAQLVPSQVLQVIFGCVLLFLAARLLHSS